MPVSADIYRSVITPQEQQQLMYRNQLAQLATQQATHQAQQQNALRQLYGNPQFDPSNPSPNMLRQVGSIDPAAAQYLMQNQQRTQLYNAEVGRNLAMERRYDQLDATQRQQTMQKALQPVRQAALMKYQDILRQTGNQNQAMIAAQATYAEGVQDLNDGSMSPNALRAAQTWHFNPDIVRAQMPTSQAKPPATRMFPVSDNKEQLQQWDPESGFWKPVSAAVDRFKKPQVAPINGGPMADFEKFYSDLDPIDQNALDMQSWSWINNHKLPYRRGSGGGADRNDAVMKNAARIALSLGKSPEQMSSMPAQWKANAQSLVTLTKRLDSTQAALESLHNNLSTWDSLAKGEVPKLGGDATQKLSGILSKINFTGIQSLDDIKLKIQQETNDPTVSAYLVAAMAAGTDYARIMQGPQSAASLTENGRKEALSLIKAGANDKAREAIIGALDSDTAGQVKGMEDQRQRISDRMDSVGNTSRRPPTKAQGNGRSSGQPEKTVSAALLRQYAASQGVSVKQAGDHLKAMGYDVGQ